MMFIVNSLTTSWTGRHHEFIYMQRGRWYIGCSTTKRKNYFYRQINCCVLFGIVPEYAHNTGPVNTLWYDYYSILCNEILLYITIQYNDIIIHYSIKQKQSYLGSNKTFNMQDSMHHYYVTNDKNYY